MMKELEFPFCAEEIIKNKKLLRKQLLGQEDRKFLNKKIAILGGATTRDIKIVLELFLLNYGIKPLFYESEYNQYYEDGRFPNQELENFAPDLIYICTSVRNIVDFPLMTDDIEVVERKLLTVYERFYGLWIHLAETYHCPIIQNNFENPPFRIMGNKDASDIHGRVNFVTRLNMKCYEYAQMYADFYICDINYLSATYGLDKWSDAYYWYMYKYAVSVPAIPYLAYNVANIIKSIYGKNKKVLNLDLDNTLWGGVIGDEGADNIEIGQETPLAQAYSEFQRYLKTYRQLGILLTINTKNDKANALSGLKRPDSILREEDFVSIKANWNPKSQNLMETAEDLNLLPESFVFVDDNPAEREIIRRQVHGVAAPEITGIENYIRILDQSGFFEVTELSADDMKRTEMYQENIKRNQLWVSFESYEEYLHDLCMKGEIQGFIPAYMARIAQLVNKSNQFNLTTKRYSQSEIEMIAEDPNYITLYGKLKDKFGDNGVVSVMIGKIEGMDRSELHMELWIMSCRVLKRNMEYAMMDALVEKSVIAGIRKLVGYYYPSAKNSMVKDFYGKLGFTEISEDENGNMVWEFVITEDYQKKQNVIEIVNL